MTDFILHWLRPIFERLEAGLGDWGLAVIFFTMGIRLCLVPISIRQADMASNQFVFSRKAAELQKNWQGSKEKLAEKMAELAQKHRFNPLGMMMNALLQSPVYIAVYSLFSHLGPVAHSILVPWVSSIGQKDPTLTVPLLVATMNAILVRVSLIPREFMPKSGWFSSVIMWGISYMILWKAPVATALYYGTSGIWGAVERRILRGRVRRAILEHLDPESLTVTARPKSSTA